MADNIKLQAKFSTLYKKTNYLMPISSVINTIYEYDMKSAGLSVIKEYKLLNKKIIDKLDTMDKNERNETIGKLKINNKDLVKSEKRGITTAREEFFRNNLIKDQEVLSIKNDAIFVIGRKVKTTDIGENIHFSIKNTYSSYHNINGIEFYYNKKEDRIDVKGLSKNIDSAHEKGVLEFLKTVFRYIEYDRTSELKRYIIDYSIRYKAKKLNKECYKEFNHDSLYRYKHSVDNYFLLLDDIDEDFMDDLDINYNYLFIILPIIQRYLY